MYWMLAVQKIERQARTPPYTIDEIPDAHSIVYKIGTETIPNDGSEESQGPDGTFARGSHRIAGFVFTRHAMHAPTLLTLQQEIDLLVTYQSNQQTRLLTIFDVIFTGDVMVSIPESHDGLPNAVGIPFRCQIAAPQTVDMFINDEEVTS
ncbi:MAG: hypothetical protein ACPGXK_17115 [Phycisphaerae bacterium]